MEQIITDYKAAHKNMEVAVLKQPFEVRGMQVHFQLAGELQKDIFSNLKPELTGLLRRKINHARLDVTFEMVEESQGKNLYTSSDKLRYLLEKSEMLRILKDKFGLETDF